MKCNRLLSAITLAVGLLVTTFAMGGDEEVNELISEHWAWTLKQSPVFAGQLGDRTGDGKLAKVSLKQHSLNHRSLKLFLKKARLIDAKSLSKDAKQNLDIFIRFLGDEIAEYEFQSHLIPITNRWGFHMYFAELHKRLPFENAVDYDSYIGRLDEFARYTNEHIELMREGIRHGFVLPAVVLEGYQETITTHIYEDATKSPFYTPFTKFPKHLTDSDRQRLSAEGLNKIASDVIPSYQRFLEFMNVEYLPATRSSLGASALPNGREFYRHRVRKFTTLEVSPEEVHSLGISEVKRIRAEMESIPKVLGFEGNFDAFLRFLRTDPQFYPSSAESYKREIAFILKKMDGRLPELFGKLPRTPYGLKEIPEYIAPKTTAAYYQPPSGDGRTAGFYFINTYNLKSRPLYQLEALSLHEAVPGHHLQLALQQEIEDMPAFRKYNGFTAFIEGWALYSERLGLETGFYEDPYSDFGRLSYEMWRACRLVVDTGIHYMGWTRDQAIDYMEKNTALSRHNIVAEVDRYISWPGQALAYKMGELKIRELRSLAEKELGERFDIRKFHDVVLGSGAVPLMVLEENVIRYIKEN